MQAIVYKDGEVKYVHNYPDPKPGTGEVLIAVETAGICATDLALMNGYMGFSGILGHEFVGTVIKGPKKWRGKRVAGEINCVCGKCDMCQSGLSTHCRNRQVVGIYKRNGTFAEFITLPERNIHLIPDSVDNDTAVFSEPLAAAFQIVQQAPVERHDKVVVVGDGRLGLLAVQVLARQDNASQVVLLGKHEEKLLFAEKRGIQGILLNDMPIKNTWDIVVDCTGTAEGFATACALTRPRGRLILKSTWATGQLTRSTQQTSKNNPDNSINNRANNTKEAEQVSGASLDLSPIVINELQIIGSRCGPLPIAIKALAAREIITDGLITARYRLEDAKEAFRAAGNHKNIKVVFDI